MTGKKHCHPCESEDLSTQEILGSCLSASPRMTGKRDSRFLPIGKPKNDRKKHCHPCESEDLSAQGILGSCLSASPRMTEKRDSRFLPIGKPKNDRGKSPKKDTITHKVL